MKTRFRRSGRRVRFRLESEEVSDVLDLPGVEVEEAQRALLVRERGEVLAELQRGHRRFAELLRGRRARHPVNGDHHSAFPLLGSWHIAPAIKPA